MGLCIRTKQKGCPRWDLNPYWKDFKSSASAIGLLGRNRCEYSKLEEKKKEPGMM